MTHGWPLVPLGEILIEYKEYIEAPEARVYPKLSVKLYGKGVILDTSVDGATLKMQRHQLAKAGQVILSEIWGKKGAIGFVPLAGEGALCTSHFFLFDVNESQVLQGWLDVVFRANYLAEQLDARAFGTTGYAAVRPKDLLAATIPLPPLPEQQRIVARIEQLAARIEEARGLSEYLAATVEQLLSASSKAIFSGLSDSRQVALEDVCLDIIDCLHSNPIYSDTGIPTVRSPDVGWGKLFLETALKTSEAEYERRTQRGRPQFGDIVLVREGGGTGKAGLVEEGQELSLGQRVMLLRPDLQKVLPRFVLRQWLSPWIQQEQIAERVKGSASPHLNIGTLRQFRFILPPLAEQRRIVAYLDNLQTKADRLKALQSRTAADLNALLPAILDRAFRGEL